MTTETEDGTRVANRTDMLSIEPRKIVRNVLFGFALGVAAMVGLGYGASSAEAAAIVEAP